MSADPTSKSSNPITAQTYRELPVPMYSESDPATPAAPEFIEFNQNLLDQLGVNSHWLQSGAGLSFLSGQSVDAANRPIAMAYSGHQFGQWVPLLGDGRAHMLGQFVAANGSLHDVQLKGSGRTRFSRGGDGLATLGAVLREYMVSEAMAGLGIPTTRSLAVIGTGNKVLREQIMPGAILVRTAASHLRVGSFQFAASHLDQKGLQALADFTIRQYFPGAMETPDPYVALLEQVIGCQSSLCAQWMLTGFIHGVMNTDNMSIVGETIDYGPCAFIDEFHPHKVFSSIDQHGRYAWDQQPTVGIWNLMQFARTITPLLHQSPERATAMAEERLAAFAPEFDQHFQRGLQNKLGLNIESSMMDAFIQHTFKALTDGSIDFTVFFDQLTGIAAGEPEAQLLALFDDESAIVEWLQRWRSLRATGSCDFATMRSANPRVIARNHQVEHAINAAVDDDNFQPFRRLCRVLLNPYELSQEDHDLMVPPQPAERVSKTYCGT